MCRSAVTCALLENDADYPPRPARKNTGCRTDGGLKPLRNSSQKTKYCAKCDFQSFYKPNLMYLFTLILVYSNRSILIFETEV